ncbi:U1 small nuclear ribonucleoprotein C [Coemansia aciculifera]|uniref:U1 small nuclear ribonucleoprotein C n=1 Tax=Coemansia pectinata TaxID=1052879 RepID=A0A9W8L8L1_9FUNG|nr:U1 small nuclear ribonucleoprotein C [Coemansia pectinata]KAJ2881457.1 U1 small nuclear ribonucleoprotein C [Coemansia aciculifera]
MPKYYCDYCDIFLTHDSSSVRKAHNTGWKHINQVAQYYRDLDPSQTQEIIDHITFAYGGYMPPPAARSFSPPKYEDRRDDRGRPGRDGDRSSRGRSQSRSYGARQHPYAEGMPPPPPPTHAMSMMMSGGGGPPMPPHGAGMRHPPPMPHMHQYSGGPALSAAPQFRDDRDREWRSRGPSN